MNKRYKITVITLFIAGLFIAISLSFYFSKNDTKQVTQLEKRIVKIGIIAPMTGNAAVRGQSAQQGLNLALKKIARSDYIKNTKLELIYQDVPTEKPKDGPAAFKKLAEIDKVSAVIGPMGSSAALTVAPLVDQNKIPTIIHTASAREVTANNEYVFRLWVTAQDYANALWPEIQTRGYKKIAILTATSDNTTDLLNIIKNLIANATSSMSLVADEKTAVGVMDFRTQLTKIRAARPDAIFLNLFDKQFATAAKQIKELGLNIPLFANSVMSAAELQSGAQNLERVFFPHFAGYSQEARRQFMEEFGNEPIISDSAVAAHDALLVLVETIAKIGTDPEKMKNYIYHSSFKGLMGEISFQSSGESVLPVGLMMVKDGAIVKLTTTRP